MSNRKMKVVMVSQPRQKDRKRQGSVGSNVAMDPAQYNPKKRYSLKLRYAATSDNLAAPITINILKAMPGGIVIGASAFTPFCDAVRIKRIRMWCPCLNGAAPVTVGVLWNSLTQIGLPLEVTDTSSNIMKNAYLDCRPPKNSLVGEWLYLITGTGTLLFTLQAPQGTIMDLDLEVQQRDDTSNPSQTMSSGPTLGSIGFGDASSITFQPVGLPSVHIP